MQIVNSGLQKSKGQKEIPKGRPMVTYDSKTKCLSFKRILQINGEPFYSHSVDMQLENFDELTRQVAIAVAKQAINFANGHKINELNLVAKTVNRKEPVVKDETSPPQVATPKEEENAKSELEPSHNT